MSESICTGKVSVRRSKDIMIFNFGAWQKVQYPMRLDDMWLKALGLEKETHDEKDAL